jgi:glycosyltransferase involved in cell wall biosynthesis
MTKIFSFPAHGQKNKTSGVDFSRVIQPMEHLNKLDGFEVTLYHPKDQDKTNWLDVAQNNDIIFLNYVFDAWRFAAMGSMVRKFNKKLVMDVDDDMWDILEDNPIYSSLKGNPETLENFNCMLREVDAITTTSQYLKNVIHKNAGVDLDKIHIMPNRVDLDLYNTTPEPKVSDIFTIMHFGSTTHFMSLESEEFMNGVDMIMKEYPNVEFQTVGAFVPNLRAKWGRRYINSFGDGDIYKWAKNKFPEYIKNADVIVAPLKENLYNRCKSNIKFLETSTAKKPFIGQAIRQYREVIKEGETGFTALWRDHWYTKIKALIENPKLGVTVGENAYNYVKENHQMKDNIGEYVDLFNSLTKSK